MNQISHFSPEQGEQIKKAIRGIYSVLCADHGHLFISQFKSDKNPNGITPNAWKYRLHQRVYGCSATEIVNGFERISEQLRGQRMPTTDEIVTAIRAEKRKQSEIEQIASAENEIKSTGGIAGYVDELEKRNLDNPVTMREIVKMRAILHRPTAATEAEQQHPVQTAQADHDEILRQAAEARRIRMPLRAAADCGFPGCSSAGTLTNSTNGTNAWYCMRHFRSR